ncbi:hypothetical protein BDA99DRAFT_540815 [Phascolomyces articulosus]|uniref:F-box domain-containing protein n=1 Tax=Phascolomyces articulosus TaxID=60185 RepID=A0AAD5JSQ0_9FUNG|nr:hypothetical protein BDA99DRAFT_540815 [Phascolomyces articulosus]
MDIDSRLSHPFTTTLDTAATLLSLDEIKHAFSQNDYEETIQLASAAVARIQHTQLMSLLDRRAFAFGMQGKFDKGVKDANTMIQYDSGSSAGYLRLGHLLKLQGKQKMAIQVYEDALEKGHVLKDDPGYELLIQEKKLAEVKNEHRFDLLAAIPFDLVDEIIQNISEIERAIALLEVSGSWHRRIAQCKSSWTTIENDNSADDDMIMVRALPYISSHIKNLELNTVTPGAWLAYMDHLEKGHFTRLKSLFIESNASTFIDTHSSMSILMGFWKIRNTLTSLHLEYYEHNSPLKITEILFYCPYLKRLHMDTVQGLADLLGDMDLLTESHGLMDLKLETYSTSGDALKPLMKKCPNIRRLYMDKATPATLSVVHDECPRLEILGYNANRDIPGWEALNETYNNDSRQRTVMNNNKRQEKGELRAIYTTHDLYGVPASQFMELLKKNQATLERLHANLSKTKEQVENDTMVPIPRIVTDMAFERLESLVYWADHHGVLEKRLLEGLRPTIKQFNSIQSSNIPAIVDALIELPPVQYLKLSCSTHTELSDRKHAAEALLQLFKYYATASTTNSNQQQFEKFTFEYCDFISDEALDALADIKTLKELCITDNSPMISFQGFNQFLLKVKKNNIPITRVVLKKTEILFLYPLIHNIQSLEILHLELQNGPTNDTIQYLVDHAPSSLHSLLIKYCPRTGPKENILSIVNNSSSNIKHVQYLEHGEKDGPEEIDL